MQARQQLEGKANPSPPPQRYAGGGGGEKQTKTLHKLRTCLTPLENNSFPRLLLPTNSPSKCRGGSYLKLQLSTSLLVMPLADLAVQEVDQQSLGGRLWGSAIDPLAGLCHECRGLVLCSSKQGWT